MLLGMGVLIQFLLKIIPQVFYPNSPLGLTEKALMIRWLAYSMTFVGLLFLFARPCRLIGWTLLVTWPFLIMTGLLEIAFSPDALPWYYNLHQEVATVLSFLVTLTIVSAIFWR